MHGVTILESVGPSRGSYNPCGSGAPRESKACGDVISIMDLDRTSSSEYILFEHKRMC